MIKYTISCVGRSGGKHIDGGQTAIPEAVISQARDGVGNGDGGQTAAFRETTISQTRDGVGNLAILASYHSFIGRGMNNCIAIFS